MAVKEKSPPATQRVFRSSWGELDYLCAKAHYWLHVRCDKAKATRYKNRLARVLKELPKKSIAILRQTGLALLAERSGDFGKAVAHRTREIELMERLHRTTEGQDEEIRAFALQGRGLAVLQERREMLQSLKNRKRDSAEGIDNMH